MNQITLWRADLDQRADLCHYLSPSEQERADRFARPLDRARYCNGRALLRWLLAQRLDQPAARIRIARAPGGKPFLPDFPDFHFNLAHSGPHALFALSPGRAVGVDIERLRPNALARAALAPAETAATNREFLQLWTLKEAVLKAEGGGLTVAPNTLDVSNWKSGLRRLNAATDAWELCARWQLQTLALPDCVAALTVEKTAICPCLACARNRNLNRF